MIVAEFPDPMPVKLIELKLARDVTGAFTVMVLPVNDTLLLASTAPPRGYYLADPMFCRLTAPKSDVICCVVDIVSAWMLTVLEARIGAFYVGRDARCAGRELDAAGSGGTQWRIDVERAAGSDEELEVERAVHRCIDVDGGCRIRRDDRSDHHRVGGDLVDLGIGDAELAGAFRTEGYGGGAVQRGERDGVSADRCRDLERIVAAA